MKEILGVTVVWLNGKRCRHDYNGDFVVEVTASSVVVGVSCMLPCECAMLRGEVVKTDGVVGVRVNSRDV